MWFDFLYWVYSKVVMLLIKGMGGGGCDDFVNLMGVFMVFMFKWIIKVCKFSLLNLYILI